MEIISSPKNFKILSLAKSFLIETKDYSLESRTVLNSIIDDFIRKFRNSCRENFGKYPEKHM